MVSTWVAWAAAVAVLLALLAGFAALMLLRQRGLMLKQASELTRDLDTLNDRLWVLAESEEHYRSLIAAQGDLIVRRDGARIVYANAAYAALLGLGEADIVGTAAAPRLVASRPVQALEGGARVFDECLATPEGERWISWVETVVPVALGRSVLQRVGRDITARIAGEQALDEARARAESASEAKSRFLATVSHEFRTPLNGILGMADLLGDTGLDPEQKTYVRALRTSGEALLGLVDDILDFAKVEAGKFELASEPFELGQLVETVSELMAPRAQAKGIELSAHLAPDLPTHVVGDRDRLRQILLNLVGNAIKFTESGGVGIALRRSGDRLVLAVADTGPGIPEERRQAIFEEFEQVEGSSARQEGTGLGLAIVRRLAILMGGSVGIEDRPEGGSLFEVLLPLAAAPATAAPALPDWRGKRVLVVSAAPFGALYLREAIVAAGGAAVPAADAAAARQQLRAGQRWDAVLIDESIGRNAAAALAAAASRAGTEHCLIMLSPLERRQFGPPREAGFSGFLVKPVRARSLYERLSPQPAQQAAANPVQQASRPSQPSRPRLTVLVAEDNEINALLATRTLERFGCEAVWVGDGRKALAAIRAGFDGKGQAFDLALLDIRMPELDGLAVARAVRKLERGEPQRPALPLVAVSANVAESDRAAALAAGMDDCLAKPLDRAALQRWLDRVAEPVAATRSA